MTYVDPELEDDLLEEDEIEDTGLVKNLRKQVNEKSKAEKEALARAETAERALAFRDSGLDLDNPQHKFFADHYEGDMTADAVRSQASDLGFLAPPAPAVSDGEVAAHAEIANVVSGADTAANVDPADAALAEAQALGRAGTPYKVAEIYEKHGLQGPG